MQPLITRIGLAEILPLKTLTVPPYTTTNTVVYGDSCFMVIDPGPADLAEQEILIEYVRRRVEQGQHFFGIGLTHHHGDHIKAAELLAKTFHAPIIAHINATRHLKFVVDHVVFDREKFSLLDDAVITAFHTPGHADDHLVFLDEKRGVLIAGDMITDRGTTLIPPASGSLSIYLESLDQLSKLPLTTIIPAHGQPITDKPNTFLKRALAHRYERILAVLDAVIKAKPQTLDATDITLMVYKNLTPDDLIVFAQLSVESSLLWLLKNQLVEQVNNKWTACSSSVELREQLILSPLKRWQALI